MTARFAHIRKKLENGLPDPRKPLSTPNRERFCQMIAAGTPVPVAYQACGYKGGKDCRSQLRRCADVDQRVTWLIEQRIDSDTRARHRREKPIEDARLRLVRELEKIAYSDVRDLLAWDKEPIVDADGTVTGYRDRMTVTPSRRLKPSAAAAVKSVTTKSGALKFDVHDKLNALTTLAKILGMTTDAAQPPSVTVNQVNVGPDTALDAARRLAFALAAAQHAAQQRQQNRRRLKELRPLRLDQRVQGANRLTYRVAWLASHTCGPSADLAGAIWARNRRHRGRDRHPGRV